MLNNVYTILFSSHALDDIEYAVVYYGEQQNNLGNKFAKQVEHTLEAIRKNPFYSSVRYDEIRCAIVKNFPFLIHYYIDEKSKFVYIVSVYNTHQKPLW